jgi:capsular exopolysaccharide synthesis family protein
VVRPLSPQQKSPIHFWRVIWAKRLTVLLVAVLAVAGSIGVDLMRSRQYTATASLQFFSQYYTQAVIAPVSSQDVVTDIQLVTSAAVKVEVAKILKAIPPSATVTQVGTTSVATVTVTSPDPRFAAQAANAYVKAYITQTQNSFLAQAQSAQVPLQTQITNLQTQITNIQNQLVHASGSQSNSLTSQLNQLTLRQETLQSQLSQIQISTAQATGGGRLVSPALVPKTPSSPKPVTDALLALLLGLVAGIVIVLLRDFFDDRIKSQEDLETVSNGLTTLGLIPKISDWKDRKTALLVTRDLPNSPPSEAYRGLRTSVQFASLEQSISIIEVTSASSGDGKTTTAANLAVSMAEAGQRVVLVSCDLRKPRIHEFFGLSNGVGFTSVLLDEVSITDACVPVPGVERLWLLRSGPVPANPSELIGSQRGRQLFRSLGEIYDVVIIDTPPVLPVTDAVVMATIADAVLFVCAARSTTGRDLAKGLELLGRVDANVLGLILNIASASDAYVYYRYGETYGGYGYTSNKSPKPNGPSNGVVGRGRRSNGSRGANVPGATERTGDQPKAPPVGPAPESPRSLS